MIKHITSSFHTDSECTSEPDRIQVVEDELIIGMEIKAQLEALGFQVVAVSGDGRSAIDDALHLRPDLILMDINLQSEVAGIDAGLEIRRHRDIPIVFLTAYGDEETVQAASECSPYGYIMKPFEERELYTTLKIALFRHRTERKRVRVEHWHSATLHSLDEGIITIDRSGHIQSMNPVATQLLDCRRVDGLGIELSEILTIEDREGVDSTKSYTDTVLEGRKSLHTSEHQTLVVRSGERIPVMVSITPIRTAPGDIDGAVIVFRDVRKQLRLKKELDKARKLESVGVLAGGIAHDFNNYLSGILGNISMARTAGDDPGKLEHYLCQAEQLSQNASQLTKKLITFAKGGDPVFDTWDVHEIVRSALRYLRHVSRLEIKTEIRSGVWSVLADRGQLVQALQNLLENASDATDCSGTVIVRAENIRLFPGDVAGLDAGYYVTIEVEDDGCGIENQYMDQIFDPYFTTKDTNQGLGLPVCYSIVQKHGGQILTHSGEGKGTIMRMYIPAETSAEKISADN